MYVQIHLQSQRLLGSWECVSDLAHGLVHHQCENHELTHIRLGRIVCVKGCVIPGNGGSHTQLATWAIVLSSRNESELAGLESCLFIELDQLILEA
jgi:hypothetical protein